MFKAFYFVVILGAVLYFGAEIRAYLDEYTQKAVKEACERCIK